MYVTRMGASLRAHTNPKVSRRKSVQSPLATWNHGDLSQRVYTSCLLSKPRACSGAYDFKWEYLCSELLSKLPNEKLVPPEVRRNNAIDKMLESEESCALINRNGYNLRGFGYTGEWYNTIFDRAKAICSSVLGDFSYDIFEHCAFTSGASTSRSRQHGDSYYKYSGKKPVHVTPGAYKYAAAYRNMIPRWVTNGTKFKIVPGNRITTVPKKTEIDRAIAMEPDMNMLLQLAVGRHIRRRLRLYGINLNDQTLNQRLAKRGSQDGSLATIDLSSASDSICVRLVQDIIPVGWYTVLDDLRSHYGKLPDGSLHKWEKFSSMGNGFTFELETLIFYALSRAVIENESRIKVKVPTSDNAYRISVYGDDIICQTQYADSVILALYGAGFTTNTDKTFTTGPFRESCGKHYYDGADVTPFYVRKPINHLTRVIWLCNSIRSWSAGGGVCDPSTYDLWKEYKKLIPKRLHGGKDLTSISSLASPGKMKERLISVTKRRNINGYGALLRSFQNSYSDNTFNVVWYRSVRGLDPSFINWCELNDYILPNSEDRAGCALIQVCPSLFRFSSNDEQWADIPLYSDEIVLTSAISDR